jgi:hypothetical protein
MTASKRIEEVVLRVLEIAFREAGKEYRQHAKAALVKGHPIEASIARHIAARLAMSLDSLDQVKSIFEEWRDLAIWFPIREEFNKPTNIERKAALIAAIHSLKSGYDASLIKLVTQKPGRPSEGRLVAIRAMELHIGGQSWAEIERVLLPHRREVRNPGQNIRRQVQFLKNALKRYSVQVDRH